MSSFKVVVGLVRAVGIMAKGPIRTLRERKCMVVGRGILLDGILEMVLESRKEGRNLEGP